MFVKLNATCTAYYKETLPKIKKHSRQIWLRWLMWTDCCCRWHFDCVSRNRHIRQDMSSRRSQTTSKEANENSTRIQRSLLHIQTQISGVQHPWTSSAGQSSWSTRHICALQWDEMKLFFRKYLFCENHSLHDPSKNIFVQAIYMAICELFNFFLHFSL